MKYGKSDKGYFVAKGKEGNVPASAAAAATDAANPNPTQVDPLEQFATSGQGKASSFTQAGFKRQYSYGDKELYAPNNFGEGGAQIVNVDGKDFTIGFLKDKTGDRYSAVLVDQAGNVRPGSTRDQAINEMLSNFQNLSGSQVARSLYDFGIAKTTSSRQKWAGERQVTEGVGQGAMMPGQR